MSYYDRIATTWNELAGDKGAPLQANALNKTILDAIPSIDGQVILELGAGNGYLMPMILEHFEGQTPGSIVVTDQSESMIAMASEHHFCTSTSYETLDIREPFPFQDGQFDVIIANMVFSEVITRGMARALAECSRVLAPGGRLVATVSHPAYVEALSSRGLLKRIRRGRMIMPGDDGMHLPVVERSVGVYERALDAAGFSFKLNDISVEPDALDRLPEAARITDLPQAMLLEGQFEAPGE
jgi:SAM-dependent methyltransferase